MNPPRGKILVIRGGAIGDFILTLPAIAALRRQFPETHLEVLGYPHIVQLALIGGLVDAVRSIEARSLAGFFARSGALSPELAAYFAGFNVIVSYLYDPDRVFQTNVASCSRAQFIVGPHRPNERQRIHATEVFLKPLERLAIFEADYLPRLVFDNQPQADHCLALHPGSGSEAKNWPEAGWAELLQHLVNKTNLDLLLVGGEAEGGRLQRLAAALPPARTWVAQSLPLTELARQLRSCVAFVGHDSGISHLAAALGLPGLVLWGKSAQQIWRPQGEHIVILKPTNSLATLGASQVFAELMSILDAIQSRR
ncbi:MAG TPA: glycosyltransferase family 9 protein [Verrucomicrobiae bacterium]|nr:glycosyltransferase family 9 protein [Verrucomicrobiae bacterium]